MGAGVDVLAAYNRIDAATITYDTSINNFKKP